MAAVILISTVPLALLLSYQIFDSIRVQQRRVDADLVRSAAVLGQFIHREIRRSADALSSVPPGAVDEVASLRGALLDLQREHPDWQSVFAVKADGGSLVDSADLTGRAERAPVRWVPPLETRRLPGMHVSGLVTDTRDGVPATMVAVPLPTDATTQVWVGARIAAASWQRVLDESAAPGNGFLTLLDSSDRVIARTLDPAAAVGKSLRAETSQLFGDQASGAGRGRTIEGREMIVGWQHLDGGWRAAAVLHADEIDAGARQAIVAAIATASACMLLGLTLGLAFARRLVEPLDQLASGDMGVVPQGSAIREIDGLRDRLLLSRSQEEGTRRQLEAKVAEFQVVFDNSPVGLAFAHDAQCGVVVHNAAMTALFGPPWSGSVAPRTVVHEGCPLLAGHFPLFRAASRGEVVPPMELAIDAEGRTQTVVLSSAVPLRDARGWPRGAIAAAIDITQRKEYERRLVASDDRLRDNQHLIDLIQEAGQVGFFHYSFDGDRWTNSPGQARLFDPPDELTMMTDWLHCVVEAHQVRLGCELAAIIASRQAKSTLEYQIRRSDGERRWMSSRVLLDYHPDGRPLRMLGVTVDIDEHKSLESERNESMRREQQARRDAEAASRAKDEFLAMLGHELRNPLGAIASAVEVLQQAGKDSALGIKAIQIIGRQSGNLARILDDLLDVARVISGKVVLTRQRFELAEMVARAVSTARLTGQKTHDIAECLAPVWVDADPTRVEQVLNNLLGNAFRYTPAGRPVEVHVFRDGTDAVLQVRDHGIGIPAPLLDRVFDLFVQGERSLDRRGGGLGIGLTLVRQLLTLHGGSVTASSSDQGSVFEARLPAEAERGAAPGGGTVTTGTPGQSPESARRRAGEREPARQVVLVEDNADALQALRLLLELEGHDVHTTVDGVAGLAAILAREPDVAIVDLGLPGLDGFGVARQARAAGRAGLMIAMSGYGQAHDVRDALAAGFDAHLVKPISADRLRGLMALGVPAPHA